LESLDTTVQFTKFSSDDKKTGVKEGKEVVGVVHYREELIMDRMKLAA